MTISTNDLSTLTSAGGNVLSTSGEKIGGIGQIYLDDQTEQPSWVTAKTGLFGTSESFVPLQGARVDGNDVVVNYDKDTIKGAPRVDSDGSITPEEEDTLYSYYGLGGGTTTGTADYDRGADRGADLTADRGADYSSTVGQGVVGNDTSGPETDEAMTRSEERIRVGTQQRESGRARLRKYIVTENVSQTVPVSHEEVRVVREPITDANSGAAYSGKDLSEEEHEVILHEEAPVVQKETVPVERIRLDTETVTEQVTVNEQVRKEQIDTDIDDTDVRR